MSGKKKHRTANDYLQYLRRELSQKERYSFERDLETDPFEKEALEGFETLTPDQAEEDILTLHAKLRKRTTRKRRIAWYSLAASVASLLIIGTVFLQIYDFNPDKVDESIYQEEFTGTSREEPETSITESEVPGSDEETMEIEVEDRATEPETALPAMEAEGEARNAKGPSPGPSQDASKGPSEDPSRPVAEGVPQADQPAPVERDVELDRIVHMEAEAEPLEQEAIILEYVDDEAEEPQMRERAERRAQQVSQPAAMTPLEMEKKAVTREELSDLISKQISGRVISGEDMEPIPGASISLKGRNTGVVTNMNGNFTLPLEDDSNRTLVANFVGMETQEYQFAEGQEIQLVMQPDMVMLDEVVVVGQGIQREATQTGAVTTVRISDEDSGPVRSAQPSEGYRAFKKYIEENITFPATDDPADRAVVVLRFTVTTDGEIKDPIPLRTPGDTFTQEAIRLVTEGPSWEPASDESGNIEEIVRLRIVFKK